MSNFEFLKSDWPEFIDDAMKMEQLVRLDPRGACVRARYLVEQVVLWMYKNDEDLELPYDTSMGNITHQVPFKKIVGRRIFQKVNAIRKIGNLAAHDKARITEKYAIRTCEEVFHFMYWLWCTYNDGEARPELAFDVDKIPESPSKTEGITPDEYDTLKEKLEKQAEQLREVQQQAERKGKALQQRNREIKQMRLQSNRYADNHDYNEAQTRELLIDVLLREAGWDPSAPDVREYEINGMPGTQSGKGYVDYVLWDDDGKPLGLVEAKRTRRSYEEGQQQAKLYANCLEKEFGVRPVIFLSNGYEIYIWDDQQYPLRPLLGFYTKKSLQKLHFQRREKEDLHLAEVNKDIGGRYYQIQAARRVGERFQKGHRTGLLVMATGTGKTRTAISISDMLIRKKWARRVLFLADRNALVRQAYKAFKEHVPNLPVVNLVEEKNDDAAKVVFSTYPTILNQIESLEEGKRKFDVGHFDLVIIDETHRSVYNVYGAIFDYFDSLRLGLTATPKGEVDRNTYEFLDHEPGHPTFSYELDEAVDDKFLVPSRKLKVRTKFMYEGVKYEDLSEDEKAEYEELFADDEGRIPEHIDSNELYRWLFNEDTVKKVLEQLMTEGIKVEGGDRLGKTIIFAKNHKHALFIRETFDKYFPEYRGNFARVIDNTVERASSLIDDFGTPGKDPVIAISVDMMDTGIDVPEIVNLVFFKPVRSRTKFHQMIGRGTRLRKDLFGPGDDKRQFLIFDYCGNFEFFDEHPEGYEPTISESLGRRIFESRLSLAYKLDNEPYKKMEEYQEFRKHLLDTLHQAVQNMDEQSILVRPHLSLIHRLSDRGVWNHLESQERREIVIKLGDQVHMDYGDDEEARRFDYLMLILQHQLLDGDLEHKMTKRRVMEMGERLYSKIANVPAVQNVEKTIETAIDEAFWEDPSLLQLEQIRIDLRDLIRLIDWKSKELVYSNFEDQFDDPVEVAPDAAITEGESTFFKSRYKRKIEQFIKEHKHHLIIEKIRNAKPLTEKEVESLEKLLINADPEVDLETFHRVVGEDLELVTFIRSVAGLERSVVMERFGEFLQDKNLSATQIDFINQMIDFYTSNGHLNVETLYSPPFSFIDENGIDGVFENEATVNTLLSHIRELNEVKVG